MRRLSRLFVALIWLASAAPAVAEDPAPVAAADQTAIRQVIQHQIDAFLKDDGATAFAFASPALRQRFQTPAIFMAMVRQGYQPVYRPSQVTYGGIEKVDGTDIQHVLVVGPDGDLHEVLYFMEREPDGTWLIDGCMLVESEQKSS